MMVLSDDKERQGLTTAQIITSIQYDLKIGQFPEVSISDSLSRLQKAGFVNGVHSRGKEIYILSEDKLDVINLMAKEYSKTLMGVKKEIAKRMGDVLDAPVDLELENSVFSSFQKV